ncbi:MAG: 30S ribosomal protein S7 [Candidatus Pacearchaeota archaeon]
MAEQKTYQLPQFKLFDRYDVSQIEFRDSGLQRVINLEPKLIAKSYGRREGKFGQAEVNVIERLVNKIATAGHRGKKHKIEKGESTGKDTKNLNIVLEAFQIIEKRTQENPIQVLVRAIENSSPRDEVTVVEYGGAKYPQAVDVSPLRRINLSLRHIAQGSSDKAFNQKKTFSQGLAEEVIMASEENGNSFSIKKKTEAEKQADSAR